MNLANEKGRQAAVSGTFGSSKALHGALMTFEETVQLEDTNEEGFVDLEGFKTALATLDLEFEGEVFEFALLVMVQ